MWAVTKATRLSHRDQMPLKCTKSNFWSDVSKYFGLKLRMPAKVPCRRCLYRRGGGEGHRGEGIIKVNKKTDGRL